MSFEDGREKGGAHKIMNGMNQDSCSGAMGIHVVQQKGEAGVCQLGLRVIGRKQDFLNDALIRLGRKIKNMCSTLQLT
jgi:hypothetical protein